jgi:broad specificity phosphatase PhoE
VRLYVIARHGESTLNREGRISGDPERPVALTERGNEEARELGLQIANVPIDLCLHTRFQRTRDTAAIALEGRDIPFVVEPLFDDVDVGSLDGAPFDEYRAYKRAHTRKDPFPGGESLDDAARRYADAFEKTLSLDAERVFICCHEIPLRYALNAASGSDQLDGPVHELRNATPYLFTDDGLRRAAEQIRIVAA